MNMNEALLSDLGVSWDKVSALDFNTLDDDKRRHYESLAREIILGLDAHRPWMLKDPRLCMLMPLWKPLLEFPVFIHVHRQPLEVAQSLHRRDGMDVHHALGLWEIHTLQALQASLNEARLLVSYHDVLQNPLETVNTLYQSLQENGVQGLRLPADKEILAFVAPELRHAKADADTQDAYLNREQAKLAQMLDNGSILKRKKLPDLSAGAQAAMQFYESHVASELAWEMKYQQTQAAHEAQLQQAQAACDGQVQQAQAAYNAQLQQAQESYNAQLQQAHAAHKAELQQAQASCDEQIQQLQRNAQDTAQHYQRLLDDEAKINADCQSALKQLRQQETKARLELDELRDNVTKNNTDARNALDDMRQQVADMRLQFEECQRINAAQTQQLSAQRAQFEQREHALRQDMRHYQSTAQRLTRITQELGQNMEAIFNSITWRNGQFITDLVLRLSLRKPGRTARDSIALLLRQAAEARQQAPKQIDNNTAAPQSGAASPSSARQQEPAPENVEAVAPVAAVGPPQIGAPNPWDYDRWIKSYDTLTDKQRKRMRKHMATWQQTPLVSIIMPTYNTAEKWLRAAIESVLQQIYPNWELCIADDASSDFNTRKVLEEYAKRDARIKVVFREQNGHISAASNSALELATGEFTAFLDHDDVLTEHALFWMVKDILQYPDAMLWYSDEDKIDEQDHRYGPYFKSDWNPDLFLSHNLITHFAVYRTELLRDIGGFREGLEGAQDYDLALRVVERISPAQIRHVPRILYHWRTIEGSTAVRPEEKPYAIRAAEKAISDFLERKNIAADVAESPLVQGTIRVQYHLPRELPLVTLIIPTRNGLEVLRRCVESIIDKTDYVNYEILIIDNDSDDPATIEYLQDLEDNGKARILEYPHPFNYADMNNLAVDHAKGDIIGLLNNDLEVINHDWLSEMVSHALRPEVGAVGACLWYPDDTLQHGGVILGIAGTAGHAHKGYPRGHVGYMGRAALIQNFSAVTAACLLMRKACFLGAGGMDAEHFAVALNDVDLCLKLNQINLRVVWTPYAELYHHESATRGYEDTPEKAARYQRERAALKARWPQFMANDPAYSPNLTLEGQDFCYAWPPRVAALANA